MNTNTHGAPWVWGLLAALVAAAVGCTGGYAASGDEVYASYAPPPDRVEVIGPTPAPGYYWINGYWRWGGSSYDWTPGRWVVVEQGRSWQRGGWHHNRQGWFYVQGHWR
jgi:YXWGXW repeat-containing protein